ncbi:MAG: carboxypeptidase regulatory-like domain-containing protein, partial [Acidobacteria bacterium]|nr:carboxypeptidase regulatory-like domain-containing protein [Acidobacteriota bacterium]
MFRILLLTLTSVWSQSSTATLQGLISDASGAAVPGAEVSIVNLGTNMSRKFTTADSGIYSFPLLPPGRYRVEVAKSGFKPLTRDGVL